MLGNKLNLSVNYVFRLLDSGTTDIELKKKHKLSHNAIKNFKAMRKLKATHTPKEYNLSGNTSICLGYKSESYYTENEMIEQKFYNSYSLSDSEKEILFNLDNDE